MITNYLHKTLDRLKQELSLRHYLPEIEILSRGHWIDLCEKFYEQVADRFRLLVRISSQDVARTIDGAYLSAYAQHFNVDVSSFQLLLLVYSNRRKQVFELPVHPDFSVDDVLLILKELFELPTSKEYKDIGTTITLNYTLFINNKEVSPQKRLKELVFENRPLVTLWKTTIWYEQLRTTEVGAYEHKLSLTEFKVVDDQQLTGSLRIAVEQFELEVEEAYDRAVKRIELPNKDDDTRIL